MAERLRINRVRIALDDRMVEISWPVAQELQARLLRLEATARPLIDRFQQVGTSRPVSLDESDVGPLLVALAEWEQELGRERLPKGIRDLLDALQNEIGGL